MKPILKHHFPSEFTHKCNVLQPAQEDQTLSRHLLNIHQSSDTDLYRYLQN